jgi:hypothetical protein
MPAYKVDKSDPQYRKELYLYSGIVIFLTLTGGALLGYKITRNEQAIESGEMQRMVEENEKKNPKPGREHGIIR